MRLRAVALLAAWVVLAAPIWVGLFLRSDAAIVFAGHDAVVRPTFDHHVRIETGPYLPDLRMPSEGRIGVRITMGKTTAETTDELIQRYALIAGHPEIETKVVRHQVRAMAIDAALRAGFLALIPILVWELIGAQRRTELIRPTRPKIAAVIAFCLLAGFVGWQPWRPSSPRVRPTTWIGLPEALPGLTIPADLRRVQLQGAVFTQNTQQLLTDALGSYDRSKTFYRSLVDKAPTYAALLHRPEPGQTLAILVSDRHDNIGMDEVVRAFADEAGATAVIDAGDDTSTGDSWETFSLESLNDTFGSYDDRIAISGNHDHGTFVSGYLSHHGWTHLDHSATTKFGTRFYGVDDPRASGLGAFEKVSGPTFEQEKETTADEVCALDEKGERVATLIVHDASMAQAALDRGCVDLVLAGHLHVQVGPDRVVGANGMAGYSYTNGTTGGAAFAVAVGGKLRREAEFTLVTYADGRPVGLQPVRVSTHGDIVVESYVPLDLTPVGSSKHD